MLAKNRSLRLRGSVAAFALISVFPLAAEAQLSGINLGIEGSWSNGEEDWGTQATILVPLINSPAGMFYTMASGGWQHHDPAGSIGFGYRHLYEGGWGWGVYGSGDAQRSINNHKFFGATTGLEVFIPSGISVSTNVYVPLGKKNKVVNGTGNAGTVVLKDKTTGGACNPTAPAQVCKLVTDGSQAATVEHNRFGVDLTVAYEMQMGGISVTPFVAGYVFDRVNNTGLAGIMAGADLNISLTGGIALNGGIKVRYDKEQKADVILGLGLNIQLGSSVANMPTAMQKAPRRLPASMRIQQDKGAVLFDEPVIWDRNTANSPVSEVRFVNVNNMAQAEMIVAATAKDGIVVFNGNITANASLNITNDHVGLISGSTILNLKGARTGLNTTFTMAGTKGTITQNNAVDIITATNRNNVILEDLTIRQGSVGIFLNGTPNARLINLDIADTQDNGIFVSSAHNSLFDNLTIDAAMGTGIRLNATNGALLNNLTVTNSGNSGIHLDTVSNTRLLNSNVTTTTMGDGVIVESGTNVLVDRVATSSINARGFNIIAGQNITLSNSTSNNAQIGVSVESSNGVALTNLLVQRGAVGMNTIGIQTIAASTVTLTNVDVQNFAIGYVFPAGVTLTDGGFSKASGNTANCDGANDANGSISINMGVQTCN